MDNINFNYQVLDKRIEEEFKKIEQELKKTIPLKIQNIKRDIYDAYVTIVYASMENYFFEIYGNSFDVNSLKKSVTFFTGKDLRPDFSYNEKIFCFKKYKEKRFNLNSVKKNKIEEIEEEKILNDFFITDNDEENEESEEEYLDETIWDFSPIYVNQERIPLSQAYKNGKEYAINEFNKQFVSQIKPRIYKRYGIKI